MAIIDKTTIHEYCSKCGALKEPNDIQICDTPYCGNLFDDAKSNGSFFVSGNAIWTVDAFYTVMICCQQIICQFILFNNAQDKKG